MGWIVPLLSFKKEVFGIKWPTKVDMPLNKETKPEQMWYLSGAYIAELREGKRIHSYLVSERKMKLHFGSVVLTIVRKTCFVPGEVTIFLALLATKFWQYKTECYKADSKNFLSGGKG